MKKMGILFSAEKMLNDVKLELDLIMTKTGMLYSDIKDKLKDAQEIRRRAQVESDILLRRAKKESEVLVEESEKMSKESKESYARAIQLEKIERKKKKKKTKMQVEEMVESVKMDIENSNRQKLRQEIIERISE